MIPFRRVAFKLLLAASLIAAPSSAAEGDASFRTRMRALVSEGNRQYDRSSRAGIKAMADSLGSSLRARSLEGRLSRNDSLEFTADYLKLMGDWHYENGNYEPASDSEAERFFREALSLYETHSDVFGEDLDKIPMMHRELAQLHYRQERYDEALQDVEAALGAFGDAWLNQVFEKGDPLYDDMLDLQMQKAVCLARLGRSGEAEDIADEVLKSFVKGSEKYMEALRKKAKIMMLSGSAGREKNALPLYKAYFGWRRDDAVKTLKGMSPSARQDYWMRMRPFVADCFQTEGEDPGFIFDAALFSKGLLLQMNLFDRDASALASLRLGWKDIRKALPSDGCAIEFIRYEKDGAPKLGAAVVRKTGNPVWVEMAAPDSVASLVIDGQAAGARISSTSGAAKNSLYRDSVLRKAVWPEALVAAIGPCGKIYFSPDAYIHQIAIEYMLPESLAGRRVYRLTSCRRLTQKRAPQLDSALVVGGVKYNSAAEGTAVGNDPLAYGYFAGLGAWFNYLPGSHEEALDIAAQRSCPKDSLLTGQAATEAAVRSLMQDYPLVCLSTHGFYDAAQIPAGTDLKPCMSDETLSHAALALAGANRAIRDRNFDPSQPDGILSAEEISSLDMSKVDLAVISACQTGLGRVTGEGVYGIQRGLKNAGAGAMLVSLWNVNDRATSLLVARFIANISQGMDLHDAFFAARQALIDGQCGSSTVMVRRFNPRKMRSEYVPQKLEFNEPQYWNAFVLIDAI